VEQTGRYRTINREKFDRAELESALKETDSLRHRVFSAYRRLLRARRAHPAFHPNGAQKILDLGAGLFALTRSAPEGSETLLCLHEVAGAEQRVRIGGGELPWKGVTTLRDVLSGATFELSEEALAFDMTPYQVLWLEPSR
jgi:sucrose phosphorylase